MRKGDKLPSPMNKPLSGIELFDFGLGQDIEGCDTKDGAKGKVEEVERTNHYSVNPSLWNTGGV